MIDGHTRTMYLVKWKGVQYSDWYVQFPIVSIVWLGVSHLAGKLKESEEIREAGSGVISKNIVRLDQVFELVSTRPRARFGCGVCDHLFCCDLPVYVDGLLQRLMWKTKFAYPKALRPTNASRLFMRFPAAHGCWKTTSKTRRPR